MPHLQGRSARRLASSLFALAAIAICVPASASAQTAFRTGPGISGVDETCEVVHLSSDGNLATCTDASDDAGLALLDVSNLEDPVLVGQADFEAEGLEVTSATFSADDRFIIGCFVDDASNPAGEVGWLVVWERDEEGLTEVHRMPLPGQPDSIEVSPDGRYAAIAIEDETRVLPGGLIEVLELVDSDDPQTWTLHEVPIALDGSYPDNAEPQPEYVDFNQFNEIAVSIQEQNAIGIIDAPAATDDDPGTAPIERIFSAGQTNFPDDKNLNDTRFLWNPATPNQVDRQPDAVGWTADGQAIAAVAEGEQTDPHEWNIYDRDGTVIYASGENLNRNAALFGQQPVNFRGSQPEGLTVDTYKGREYVFLVTERTANASVYDITDSRAEPELVGVFPTGTRPETISFNSDRGLAIIGNETDSDPAISTLVDMAGNVDRDRPLLKGDEPWTNLRGLAGTSRSNELLAVTGENPKKLRRISLTGPGEAAMSTVASVPAAIETQAIEDVVADGDGSYWILSGGATIAHLDATGAELASIPSPVGSATGLALTASGEELVVIDSAGGAARVRISDLSVTPFTVTSGVEGQFTDLETAPDGSLVALRTNVQRVDDGLVAFPDDVVAGQSVAGLTKRLIPPSERSVQDYASGLAITPSGDVWFAYGASLKGNNGTHHGLTRLRDVFTPELPVEEDRGLPSSIPAFTPGGTFDGGYRLVGGEIYGVGTPGSGSARYLSRIDPGTGEVDPQFDPPSDFNPGPLTADASYLYDSSGIRLDRRTGEVDPGWSFSKNYVEPARVLVYDGALYLWGSSSIKTLNGVTRNGIGAVSTATGETTPFNPNPQAAGDQFGAVHDLVVTPEGRMFISGAFTRLGGQTAGGIAEIDPQTGAKLDTFDGIELGRVGQGSNPRPARLAYDPVGEDLYVSNVATVNGEPSSRVVAYDVAGASASRVPGFNPQVSDGEFEIEWVADRLIVQGQGTVNGIVLPPFTKAYALTPDGELDRGFLPTDKGFVVEESQAWGSMFSINHTIYLPAAPTNLTPPQVAPGAQEGVESSCDPGGWDADPEFTYQWQRDGAVVAGATAQTYTPSAADVGHELLCEVTGTNQLGAASASSAPVVPESGVPFLSAAPQITGTPLAGQALTVSDGTWTNSPTGFAYRWLRDGAPIDSQTASSYTLTAADSGHEIAAEVTATNAKGDGIATAAPVHVVAIAQNSAPPQINGSAAVGATLTAASGAWTESPQSYAYQWKRDGTAIPAATQQTYVPGLADEGKTLTVAVVAINTAGSSPPAASSGVTIALPGAPVNVQRPVISGPGIVGATLSCSDGAWSGERLSLSRQWLRSGDPVDDATAASYVLSEEDLGRTVSCVVSATNPGGETAAESAAVSPQPAPVTPVTILPPATNPPVADPPAAKQKPIRPKCRKGFKAKKVKGKFRCVRKGTSRG